MKTKQTVWFPWTKTGVTDRCIEWSPSRQRSSLKNCTVFSKRTKYILRLCSVLFTKRQLLQLALGNDGFRVTDTYSHFKTKLKRNPRGLGPRCVYSKGLGNVEIVQFNTCSAVSCINWTFSCHCEFSSDFHDTQRTHALFSLSVMEKCRHCESDCANRNQRSMHWSAVLLGGVLKNNIWD